MTSLLLRLPLLVILPAIGALAMLIPAAHAALRGDWPAMRAFAENGLVLFALLSLVAILTRDRTPRDAALSQLAALVGIHFVAPPLLALPVLQLIPGGTWLEASAMMVEALTTTGAGQLAASLAHHPESGRLAAHVPTLFLWAGLVAWMGGFLQWVAALAILGPLDLLGIDGDGLRHRRARGANGSEASWRLMRVTGRLLPVWCALTGALWLGLILLGAAPLEGALAAMATLSTSGILLPGANLAAPPTISAGGWGGEALVALFLLPAVSRWFYRPLAGYRRRLAGGHRADPEIRLALALVLLAAGLLFLRHWWESADLYWRTPLDWLALLWSGFFTALSFLTTAGFTSQGWGEVVVWSGMKAPGLVLLALAMVGGGVATTAGGLKLLRVHALLRHVLRERDRMIHPHYMAAVGRCPDDPHGSAGFAWLVFMLFLVTLALLVLGLGASGLGFDTAFPLAMSALTTTGPLAGLVNGGIDWGALPVPVRALLSLGMIAGRLEILALVVLLLRDDWK